MSIFNRGPERRPSLRETHSAMTRPERILFWIAAVNFIAFGAIAVALGGDALNGRAANGHYYLAQHGHLTEVSRAVFVYSIIHTLSMFVTYPLAIVAGLRARRRLRR